MTIDVLNTTGKKVSTLTLPKEIFEAKINEEILAQALRVYVSNQHQGSKKALTRGEVKRTTAKVWKQKGTGRARHGSRRAPVFVGGGVAHGPKGLKRKLTLNKKIRKLALLSSLSSQAKEKNIIAVDGLEKIKTKTKTAQQAFNKIAKYSHNTKDRLLIVLSKPEKDLILATRNLPGITITQANRLNVYELLNAKKIILTKDTVNKMKDLFIPKKDVKEAK
ncbi:50S ribosomal protein L4 [Patescibacteria group bacterium]